MSNLVVVTQKFLSGQTASYSLSSSKEKFSSKEVKAFKDKVSKKFKPKSNKVVYYLIKYNINGKKGDIRIESYEEMLSKLSGIFKIFGS